MSETSQQLRRVQDDRTGQATRIEQSRAIAEVAAAVRVAQEVPRVVDRAIEEMMDSCGRMQLAERSFFRFPRGREQITGPSIHLARELARCWGNVQSGITELSRDDVLGQSQMQAWAWDVQTNSRSVTTFIVPHARDTKNGVMLLTDMRDIYENNANQGARRMREMIFAIVPTWFVEQAKERCAKTLRDGDGGLTLPQRVAQIVQRFAELGVERRRLQLKVGRATETWTAYDIAQLTVIGASISRGEVTVLDEFPTDEPQQADRVRAADLVGPPRDVPPAPKESSDAGGTPDGTPEETSQVAKSATATEPAGQQAPAERPKGTSTQAQRGKIQQLAAQHGWDTGKDSPTRQDYLDAMSDLACRLVESSTELSRKEATMVIDGLSSRLERKRFEEPASEETASQGSETTQGEADDTAGVADPPPAAASPDAVAADPSPQDAPPPGDAGEQQRPVEPTPAAQDKATAWVQVRHAAQARGFTSSQQLNSAICWKYGVNTVADITLDMLNEYIAGLSFGTIKPPMEGQS